MLLTCRTSHDVRDGRKVIWVCIHSVSVSAGCLKNTAWTVLPSPLSQCICAPINVLSSNPDPSVARS
ncbi:hypothetical protein FB45DRAFT_1013941 [Roridomyces roridus]|uniref:Uncharacterized protein n=1 Tax=Roridomyces roridus TaxID=1738132 RepID=A0AAD7F7V2_9AGAR|nr:hypothetical protein FB45DRAFT_1013941 [Roridomyces roridus]